jgi:hypothetical protein
MTFKKLSIAAAVAAFIAPTFAIAATSQADLQKQINQLQQEVTHLNAHHMKKHHRGLFRAVPVTTTPLLARRADYAGHDLISNFPSINEDLTLLQSRAKDENALLAATGRKHASRPRSWVQLSGYVNAAGEYDQPKWFGASTHSSSLDITAAELDTTAFISPWVSAFVALKWNSTTLGNYIKANRAFITLGNLNKSPFYASLGSMYVPFGRYSTQLIADPVTKVMGRALAGHSALLAGFSKPNLSIQGFGFRGDSNYGKNGDKKDDVFGADANYYANYKNGKAQLGAGLITNLSEALDLQSYSYQSNTYGFTGHNMSKRVPAFDLNAQASFGAFQATGEFIGTTTDYDAKDMTFNKVGAKPKALHLEGSYNFNMINRPSSVGIYYDHTAQALGFALPEHSYGVMFNTEVAKDLLFAAQYAHNIDYKTTDSAGSTSSNLPSHTGTSKSQNVVYLQLAAYF